MMLEPKKLVVFCNGSKQKLCKRKKSPWSHFIVEILIFEGID
jgi:hypothetical protein